MKAKIVAGWLPPARIDLGLAVLQVVRVDAAGMAAEAECERDEAPEGLWDGEDTIYLLNTLKGARLRRVYLHELKHALVDLDWAAVDTPRRAK